MFTETTNTFSLTSQNWKSVYQFPSKYPNKINLVGERKETASTVKEVWFLTWLLPRPNSNTRKIGDYDRGIFNLDSMATGENVAYFYYRFCKDLVIMNINRVGSPPIRPLFLDIQLDFHFYKFDFLRLNELDWSKVNRFCQQSSY